MKNGLKKYFLILRLFWTLAIICVLVFCEKKSNFEFELQLNVVCILRNDELYPYAIINRAYGMDELAEYDLQDASVYISGPNIVDTLIYAFNSYFRSTKPIYIQAESTYHILVQAPGFEPVTGKTKIPGKFRIISPNWLDTMSITDTIKFTKSKGGAIYYVFCDAEHIGGYAWWVYLPGITSDTIMNVAISQFQEEYISSSGFYLFTVFVHDSNYFNYEFHWGSDYPCYGIENGIGFFGSAWAESLKVYIELE